MVIMGSVSEPQKEKWVKTSVHRCDVCLMFSIPEQKYYENEDPNVYMTLFEWGAGLKYVPKTTTLSDFKFCPYCGKKLIEIEER